MDTNNRNLNKLISSVNEEFGGDITFVNPLSIQNIQIAEKELNYKLPNIFRYFYEKESNGLFIDNKIIYSIYDENQKKTSYENLQRANNPEKSYWFKFKPEIFNDYLVIGSDGEICFTIYKHTELDNPSIYICENPQAKRDVILEKLDFGLEGLIKIMVENAFD